MPMIIAEIILTQIVIIGFLYIIVRSCYKCMMRCSESPDEISDTEEDINSIRVIKVNKYDNIQLREDSSYDTCAICIETYSPEENVSTLQPCGHMYHEECIDNWMKKSVSCPLCNT